jgi:hypothetical protein
MDTSDFTERELAVWQRDRIDPETIRSWGNEPYTILTREDGWPDYLWTNLCTSLRCAVNKGAKEDGTERFVVLFGHFNLEQISLAIRGHTDFTVKQVMGWQNPDLPFLPQSM